MTRRPERASVAVEAGLRATRPRDLAPSIRSALGDAVNGRPKLLLFLVALATLPLLAVNFVGLAQTTIWLLRYGGWGGDWLNLLGLSVADPYAIGAYRWSPPAAWIWSTLIVPIGLPAWQLVHLVALALIRDWRVIAVALLTWAFWEDLANGNVMTFVFVSAWWALRGSRTGTVAFLALSVLVPRPLMLPVLVWLLYRRPGARICFGAFVLIVIGLSVAAGQADAWVARLVVTGRDELTVVWNIGPSRLLGATWVPIGATLALLLAWKGWLGLSSVIVSPYLFHYYMLMGLLDLRRVVDRRPSG